MTWYDYKVKNKITIANRYPLLIMTKLQDCIRGPRIFMKIDLNNGFHLIKIKKGNKWNPDSLTPYGLYTLIVMQFGVTKAPTTYHNIMNHI
jgi:hypothetical protein